MMFEHAVKTAHSLAMYAPLAACLLLLRVHVCAVRSWEMSRTSYRRVRQCLIIFFGSEMLVDVTRAIRPELTPKPLVYFSPAATAAVTTALAVLFSALQLYVVWRVVAAFQHPEENARFWRAISRAGALMHRYAERKTENVWPEVIGGKKW